MTIDESTLTSADFVTLQHYAESSIGIILNPNKMDKFYRHLAPRIQSAQMTSLQEYIEFLKMNPKENEFFVNLVTNVTTEFFREKHHFDFLKSKVFPIILQKSHTLRIWSAGCASGEEPYSIAISLLETFPNISDYEVRLLATDINTNALEKAKQGIYDRSKVEKLKNYDQWFKLNLEDNEKYYRIDPNIQSLIRFKKLNLLDDWPMKKKFDIIFFRNVSIYMTPEAAHEILVKLDALLAPQGLLILGHAESINALQSKYDALGNSIYQKHS